MDTEKQSAISEQACKVLESIPNEQRAILLREFACIEQRSFSGPLPPPEYLQGYENVLSGSAERILKMAEKEQEERLANNRQMVTIVSNERRRGQMFGFLLSILLIISGFVLGYYGHDWLSGAVFTCALISVPVIFVLNKEPKNDKQK